MQALATVLAFDLSCLFAFLGLVAIEVQNFTEFEDNAWGYLSF